MVDWEAWSRDFMNIPSFNWFFTLYYKFMELERGSKFPFYIYPQVKEIGKKENTLLTFVDNLVDIHELERNKFDLNRDFYDRLLYVSTNIHRLQNDTMANLMFDTKLPKPQYDRLNSVLAVRHTAYIASMTALHTTSFAFLCYFFRYRKLSILP